MSLKGPLPLFSKLIARIESSDGRFSSVNQDQSRLNEKKRTMFFFFETSHF